MKRALATLLSFGTLLASASPAYALYKPDQQPRLDLRMVQRAARASYVGRHNQGYVRARYNELVRAMLPGFLTRTGGPRSDAAAVNRPGIRYVKKLTGDDHCGDAEYSRCHDEGVFRN